jgi:putative drug exporter of the RND superfamily
MSSALYRLGRLAARRPYATVGAWLAVAVLVVAASAGFGRDLEDTMDVPGADSAQARAMLGEAGSERAGITAQVVVTPRAADTELRSAALDELTAGVAALPNVLEAQRQVSPDGRVAVIRVQYPILEKLSPADLERLKAFAAEQRAGSPLQIELGGDLFFAFEESKAGISELIGIVAAVVILLVAFGSVIAMGLPIGMAIFGLVLGISSMSLIAYVIPIPAFAPQIASMIGLGVGIDYALLMVTRHREHLAAGMAVSEAAARSVATAGRAVVFAGGTVVIAILGLIVAGIPFLTAAAVGISTVVLIMVLASITLLPAFLAIAGPRIGGRRAHSGARWLRWGDHVSRHALVYAIAGTALLVALALPALDLRLGTPDESNLPTTRTERRAYDLVAQGFGPGINGPLVIVTDAAEASRVRAEVAADPGIASVAPPETRGAVATLLAYPTTAPQDDATFATIQRLRATVDAHVGGSTADWADIGDRLEERLPYFLGAVVLLSFLLLTFVFRSVLVPLKAAALNLLGVAAAYGVLVVVFQWGWAADLIGLESTLPIIPFIPVFMFAVLFGLSMDYEVFLLSRVREHYLRSGDNHAAVTHGIARTARVITAAALIMIAVFGGFVFDEDPRVKMFGLGLATAILVDATIIRLVLVPAIMHLLGDANWWLPRWLDRLLPRPLHFQFIPKRTPS